MKSGSIIRIVGYIFLALGLVVFASLFYRDYSAKQAHSRQLREAQQREDMSEPLPPAPETNYVVFLVFTLGCGVGLALLIARDVSHFIGQNALDFVFNDDLEGVRSPEYEAAENEWNNGRYLEAIRLMREYYGKHPREVYIALRIAEIYETNLRNYLAAALEYEEVLKMKLPPERWGWAAIHLVNLYSGKLNKPDEAMALLERIVNEYGQTAAAKKARVRLGLPEELPVAPAPEPVASKRKAEPEPEPETESESESPSNLPSGFRPRNQNVRSAARPASEMVKVIKEAARESGEEVETPNHLPPGFRPRK